MDLDVKLEFTEEQLTKFDNAVDLAFRKGFREEKLFQHEKMVGDALITYVVMRGDKGDVLVMMKLQGPSCDVTFNKPADGGIKPIPTKEFLALPDVE